MTLPHAVVRPPARHRAARYGLAAVATVVGIAAAEAFESGGRPEFYAPLIGAAAVAVWFGGFGPGLLAVLAGWGFEALIEVRIYSRLGEEEVRWLSGLVVALAIVWVTSAMRFGATRAAVRAAEATRVGRATKRLQELASELSAAATPVDVARALVERGSQVLDARDAAFGLVVGEELEIMDSGESEVETVAAGPRLPLAARAAVSEAARTDSVCSASTRLELADRYPDGLALAPTARGVIAVPLRVAGEVAGTVEFHYQRDDQVDLERLALAQLVGDLAGQALERALLYEEERALREGLDRVLRVAPQAGGGSPDEVASSVCREARRTFGADVALMLSVVDDERFAVDWREPASVLAPPGLVLAISDLPDLRAAMEAGTVMWVPDMLASLRGEALELAGALGTVSALRIPIALSGRVDRVLVLQWTRRIADPTPALLALARRFADQAGLALEQAERRLAEDLAERRAEETRRLLDVTTALAAAATVAEVVEVVLRHGVIALGADAGVVALRERGELVVAGAIGDRVGPEGQRFALSEPLPLADAVRRNELVVVESAEKQAIRRPLLDPTPDPIPYPASVSVPLAVRGSAIGGAGFGFARPHRIDEAGRQLVAAIARQASEALERARLHEAERSARSRAERAAARLAQLHALGIALGRARTQAEVADAVGRQITGVLGARSAALYVVEGASEALRAVGRTGASSPAAERYETVPLTSDLPLAVSVRTGDPVWSSDARPTHGEEKTWAAVGAAAWGVVPMIVEGRVVGALAVSFDSATGVDEDAHRFVETVARYAGQPLDRVRLLEAERVARVFAEDASLRTNRLQAASEALAVAVTTGEVADTALGQALAAVDAETGLLYLRPPGADQVDVAASAGALRERVGELARLSLSETTPVTDVVARGHVFESASIEELAGRYPEFAARLGGAVSGSAVCVPLSVGLRTVGALLLALDGRTLDNEDRDVLVTLAAQSGQALERARLLEAQQAAVIRLQRLHAITAALSGAATAEEVGRATLTEAAAAMSASAGVVALIAGDDAVDVVAEIGSSSLVRGFADALAEVMRRGHPIWPHENDPGEAHVSSRADEDGTARWAALPLRGSTGVLGALLLGFAHPRPLALEDRAWLVAVSVQCAGALERSRLYDVERDTRERVERLQSLTARLSSSLTPSEVATVVLAAGREALGAATAALVGVREDGATLEVVEAEGVPPPHLDAWQGAPLDAPVPVVDAMRSLEPIFLESRSAIVDRYPNLATAFDDLADGALAVAPLVVGDRSVAALAFAWRDAQSFEAERRQFVETLARQCAQALDRARKHESERQIAETLQRSMLPDRLPDVPGVELAARYVPGTAGMEIGGDWYDAIPLDNGRLGLAVGDVVGKGVRAASTMGQLRNALRAFALELLRPATAVSRLNALTDTFADVPFATLVYLTLDPTRRVCRYTVAGHLPPLKLGPDGTVERLDGGRSLPLGVGPDVEFEQAAIELEPGSTIVLYTDGLVERPGRSLEDGLERLERSLQGEEAAALDPGALADSVLATLLAEGDPRDDVALLVVKLAPALEDLSLTLHADPSALVDLRSELRSWLDRTGASRPQAQDILLACWEACANAIEHGSNGSGEIRVELSVDSGVVNVRVADTGSWRRPVERQGRGFGLRLLRRLMDTVRVEPLPTGTVVRMARTIRAG